MGDTCLAIQVPTRLDQTPQMRRHGCLAVSSLVQNGETLNQVLSDISMEVSDQPIQVRPETRRHRVFGHFRLNLK